MKKITFLLIFCIMFIGCTNTETKKCYQILDDTDNSIIIIDENDSPQPSITITGPNGEDPFSTYGRIEPGVFIYGDGSKMHYNTEKAWGSDGELIEGIEAIKTTCP